jgi:hypothetical protein
MQVAALHMHMQVLWRTAGAMSLKELQGPVPGVESVSDGSRKSSARGQGFLEAVNLREYVGHVLPMICKTTSKTTRSWRTSLD